MTDDYLGFPGRKPFHFPGLDGVTIYADPDVSLEVAQHEALYARRRGCDCTTLVFAHGFIEEGDRHYRLIYPIHQGSCPYALAMEHRRPPDGSPVRRYDDDPDPA